MFRRLAPAAPKLIARADVAQLVEHFTRNEGVSGSNPLVGSEKHLQNRQIRAIAAGKFVRGNALLGSIWVPRVRWGRSRSARGSRGDALSRSLEGASAPGRISYGTHQQSGLRISEAIGLTWADLDLETRRRRWRSGRQIYRGRVGPPKTRYGRRTIPLSAGTAELLAEARASSDFDGDTDPVFATPRGTPLDVSNVVSGCLGLPPHEPDLPARLPRLPAYVRLAAVRRRPQHQADPGVVRPPRPRLHAQHVRASHRSWPRGRRLPRRCDRPGDRGCGTCVRGPGEPKAVGLRNRRSLVRIQSGALL